ncbi:hypothetical protein [Albimonas pacifica]|uniref:Uncharacterized protein n=1 Tax=Albimonas pacifica TaxID=1114924 RepID=A0A1I3JJW0_9RHOB|nr:hypothetical protein [Albimonas pacifica]SFI60552.1 hypothetical protein SAMN05216258_10839 [Albimonas pacifica]
MCNPAPLTTKMRRLLYSARRDPRGLSPSEQTAYWLMTRRAWRALKAETALFGFKHQGGHSRRFAGLPIRITVKDRTNGPDVELVTRHALEIRLGD